MMELAQITLNSHHIQANELAENAEDITDKPDERVKLQHGERHGESSNSVESTGGGERVRKKGKRHREADMEERRERGGEREDRRGLGERRAGRRAGPSRMTIISGHWVHGAWRLSFASYSYACPSCLSKPSLF